MKTISKDKREFIEFLKNLLMYDRINYIDSRVEVKAKLKALTGGEE